MSADAFILGGQHLNLRDSAGLHATKIRAYRLGMRLTYRAGPRICILTHQTPVCVLGEQLAAPASHHGPDRLPAGSALLLPLRGRILNLPAVWAGRGQCIPFSPDILIRPRRRGLLQFWGRAGRRLRRCTANLPDQAAETERNPHEWVQPEGHDGEEQEAHFVAPLECTAASGAMGLTSKRYAMVKLPSIVPQAPP